MVRGGRRFSPSHYLRSEHVLTYRFPHAVLQHPTQHTPECAGQFGEEVVPIFINEAAYYYTQSGSGIGIAERAKIALSPEPFLPL